MPAVFVVVFFALAISLARRVHRTRVLATSRCWQNVPERVEPVLAGAAGAYRDGYLEHYFQRAPDGARGAAFWATATAIAFLPQPLVAGGLVSALLGPLGSTMQVIGFGVVLVTGFAALHFLDAAGYSLLCRDRAALAQTRSLCAWAMPLVAVSLALPLAPTLRGEGRLLIACELLFAPLLLAILNLSRQVRRHRALLGQPDGRKAA